MRKNANLKNNTAFSSRSCLLTLSSFTFSWLAVLQVGGAKALMSWKIPKSDWKYSQCEFEVPRFSLGFGPNKIFKKRLIPRTTEEEKGSGPLLSNCRCMLCTLDPVSSCLCSSTYFRCWPERGRDVRHSSALQKQVNPGRFRGEIERIVIIYFPSS